MNSMVYIETKDGLPVNGSLEALAAALGLGDVSAVLVGIGLDEAAARIAAYGVTVSVANVPAECPDAVIAALATILAADKPDTVLLSGTQLGKELAPRLATRLGTGCVTDAVSMKVAEDGSLVFTRPAYGGTILEQLTMHGSRPQIATVRSGGYGKPPVATEPGAVNTRNIETSGEEIKARIIEIAKEITETVNLEGADVIVSGGQGMGDAEGFELVKQLAGLLGGVVGATRPAIEAGWVSRVHQVGQSGKIVAPKLYIACGISGAMQHISGILGAKYIVAINKDEAAPIFALADLGIVGNAKEILPVMMEEIRKRKSA